MWHWLAWAAIFTAFGLILIGMHRDKTRWTLLHEELDQAHEQIRDLRIDLSYVQETVDGPSNGRHAATNEIRAAH